jgi:hypothetical protein
MRSAGLLLALAFACAPRPAAAQATASPSDIQHVKDSIYDATADIARLGSRDAAFAADLQHELDDARDEVVYFKVKLRKNESVSAREIAVLQARVDGIRSRAQDAVGRTRPSSSRNR